MSDRSHEEPTRLLVRFAETLSALDRSRPQAWRLCEAVRQVVGASGVVVTIGYLSDVRTTLCATDDVARAVDSLQELVGEGPGFDAAVGGEMVTTYLGDVQRSRWPHLSRALWDELSDVTIFAIPIHASARLTGVVTLYTRKRRPLRVSGQNAAVLARTIGTALFADGRRQQASDEGLRGPWTSRVVVYEATGMVMAQLSISADDALSLLRSRAYAANADLAAIARQVVQRELTFGNASVNSDWASSSDT
jgi:ANTAR domain-containing protein